MLTAETLIPIFNSLSKDEQLRLISMVNKDGINKCNRKELKGWSEKEVRQKLLFTIFKTQRISHQPRWGAVSL